MLQKIKNRNQGFTIVETLIVLAIAGLIILIVLLAVPALQRTARNTNLKNDATAIAGAIGEYESNNGGTTPPGTVAAFPAASSATGNYSVGIATSNQAQAKIQVNDVIAVQVTAAGGPATPAAAVKTGEIAVVVGQTCDLVASTRAVAVYYAVELSSGPAPWSGTSCITT